LVKASEEKHIYKKLHIFDIFDRTQAVIYAVRHGVVDLDQSHPR
jgi:hypothetical protein